METRNLKKITVMFLAILAIIFVADSVQGHGKSPVNEEELELNRQLKIINKPALKSFKVNFAFIISMLRCFLKYLFLMCYWE